MKWHTYCEYLAFTKAATHKMPHNEWFFPLTIMSVIISNTEDRIWMCEFALLFLTSVHPDIKNFSFTLCPPECAIISRSFNRPQLPRRTTKPFLWAAKPSFFSSPPTPADTIIPGWEALVVLPQLFGAINASSPSCAVRGGEEREREDVSREWDKIPLYVCQGGRKSCNYNIGGFGLQLLSSVC